MPIIQLLLGVALAWKLIRQLRSPMRDRPRGERLAEAVGWAALTALVVSAFWERSGVTLWIGVALFALSVGLDLRCRR